MTMPTASYQKYLSRSTYRSALIRTLPQLCLMLGSVLFLLWANAKANEAQATLKQAISFYNQAKSLYIQRTDLCSGNTHRGD